MPATAYDGIGPSTRYKLVVNPLATRYKMSNTNPRSPTNDPEIGNNSRLFVVHLPVAMVTPAPVDPWVMVAFCCAVVLVGALLLDWASDL